MWLSAIYDANGQDFVSNKLEGVPDIPNGRRHQRHG